MFGLLLLLFIALPIVELALLIEIGQRLGLLPALALILLTGAAGAALARSQGARVLTQVRAELAAGRMPISQLTDGLLILVAGVTLLAPGLITDIGGLLLLFPPTRAGVRRLVSRYFRRMVESGSARFTVVGMPGGTDFGSTDQNADRAPGRPSGRDVSDLSDPPS